MSIERQVWKFPIPISDIVDVAMPAHARLLHIDVQNGMPCLWAIIDPAEPQVSRRLRIAGTGHPIEAFETETPVGTFLMPDLGLVFHVFDLGA